MKNNKTFYICDGCDADCERTVCYINGGPCRHTTNVKYAKTPIGERRFIMNKRGDYLEIQKKT